MTRAIVLDTETTGLSSHTDHVVEIAVVDFETGDVLLHTRLNPGRPIPAEATAIHGITDEMVKDCPVFADVAVSLAALISEAAAIAGYNPFYDRGMINGEFKRLPDASRPVVKWPIIICAKRVWDRHEPKRNLTAAHKRFVDRAGFDGAHGALADTRATLDVLRAQIAEFGLEGKTWDEFDPDQKRWLGPTEHIVVENGVLLLGFGKHKGIPCHDVDLGYWRWIVNQDFPEHVKTIADFITLVKQGRVTADELHSFAYGRF